MIIVSGLARSGTSLMMNMLEAGGVPVFTDGVRVADESNPRGYREVEEIGKKLETNGYYLAGRNGCCKVLSPFLRHLQGDHEIIYMERDIGEIATSMEKMSGRPVSGREIRALEKHVEGMKSYLTQKSEQLSVLYINYNQLVTDPTPEIEKLSHFLPQLDMTTALSAIDKKLYRNRNPCHQ